tara:strand:+ start:70 stop:417 length:348 start_codon:yes stop_codon:yes gene_type:complete
MNTNIKIELTDEQRNLISNIYHNKSSAKLATRKEVNDLVMLFISQLINGIPNDQSADLVDDQIYKSIQPIAKGVIQQGYKYFMNDIEVSAEIFHDPVTAKINAEMGDLAAANRRS